MANRDVHADLLPIRAPREATAEEICLSERETIERQLEGLRAYLGDELGYLRDRADQTASGVAQALSQGDILKYRLDQHGSRMDNHGNRLETVEAGVHRLDTFRERFERHLEPKGEDLHQAIQDLQRWKAKLLGAAGAVSFLLGLVGAILGVALKAAGVL